MKWQEFEEKVREICSAHGFKTEFRFVFRDELGKGEIDVIAERYGITLCIDAKLYSPSRYRASQIRREAQKHIQRCERFSALTGKEAVPVLVTFIDDWIRYHDGCIIVPFNSLNDFLSEVHYYLAEFGYL
ncbi:restriction endonuclease [Archaeoglobus neptunius]|uniref:restriction endonuclease n=1 Tax=Archaeoglobus neptunius TaxID=2798580 RepID=UPI0019294EE4|nr:restriction endonuclease [Archaeoglobus neptunius]